MGSNWKLYIDFKLFEFHCENEKWWRITEKSHKVTKFFTINEPAVEWLASVVVKCSALLGSSKFYKARRIGS